MIAGDGAQEVLGTCRRFGRRRAHPIGNGNLATLLTLIRCGLLDGNGTTAAGETVYRGA